MRIAAVLLVIGLAPGLQNMFAARNDVVEGNPAAAVRVIVYEDLQCADCANFRAMLDQKLLPKYGAKVAFIHRDFPQARHDWARPAAVAARWVYQQGSAAGIQIRQEMLAEQDHITAPKLNAWLADFATRNHLDPRSIVASLSDPALNALIDQDRQAAVARGVTGTPTVYVGGVAFVEPIIYEDLARAIDEALGK